MTKIKAGDFVLHKIKNEVGLVSSGRGSRFRVWWDASGNRVKTQGGRMELLSLEKVLSTRFNNEYAKASLIERQFRLDEDRLDDCLIEENDIRHKVKEMIDSSKHKLADKPSDKINLREKELDTYKWKEKELEKYVGQRIWACQYVLKEDSSRPIRKLEPDYYEIVLNSSYPNMKRTVYYSDVHLRRILKNGTLSKQPTMVYDNTGWKNNSGNAVYYATTEKECNKIYRQLMDRSINVLKGRMKEIQEQINDLEETKNTYK